MLLPNDVVHHDALLPVCTSLWVQALIFEILARLLLLKLNLPSEVAQFLFSMIEKKEWWWSKDSSTPDECPGWEVSYNSVCPVG